MAENNAVVEKEVKKVRSYTLLNIRNVTTIPNSVSVHNIYTYRTSVDETEDIKHKGFFNPAFSFVDSGDTIRVFQYDRTNTLQKYYEFIVMDVDKDTRDVTVSIVCEKNLRSNII